MRQSTPTRAHLPRPSPIFVDIKPSSRILFERSNATRRRCVTGQKDAKAWRSSKPSIARRDKPNIEEDALQVRPLPRMWWRGFHLTNHGKTKNLSAGALVPVASIFCHFGLTA